VHNFEELKAKENGWGRRLVLSKTSRIAFSFWWYLKAKFEKSLGTLEDSPRAPKRLVMVNTSRIVGRYGEYLRLGGCRHYYGHHYGSSWGQRHVLVAVTLTLGTGTWGFAQRHSPTGRYDHDGPFWCPFWHCCQVTGTCNIWDFWLWLVIRGTGYYTKPI